MTRSRNEAGITTRSRSEAGITGCSLEGSSRLGVNAGKLGVDAGKLAVDAGKLGVDADKRAGVSSSRLPNRFVTGTAS
jgi:hypothetical protein